MNYKKGVLLISFLLILAISIGSVNASSDIVVDDIVSDELSTVDVDQVDNNVESIENIENNVNNDVNKEIVSTLRISKYTFEYIQNLIDNAEEGSTIELHGNYIGDFNQININKSLIINGNNATLDANDFSRILNVSSNNVEIKNLNFIRGFTYYDGGAIFWSGVNGSVVNCSFVDCYAEGRGGVVFWSGVNGSVVNCSFVDSDAIDRGGAVFWSGVNGSVVNCSFVNCSAANYSGADTYGGVVFWSGVNGSVVNCSFVNSYATYGGVVFWSGVNGSVVNCSFVDSDARDGGAIYWSSSRNGSVVNCSFVDSVAKDRGGAVFWSGVNGSVVNCSFVDCQFGSGAVFWSGVNGSVVNCSFVNCYNTYETTTIYGGAISWYRGANGVVRGCSFVNCCFGRKGGAVFWSGVNGSVVNCSFVDCEATYGGAIYCEGDNCSVVNCSFVDSDAPYGGAIYCDGDNCSVVNCNFINCEATYGGAVFWSGVNGVVNYNIFDNNIAKMGKTITTENSINCDFNFFSFENIIVSFPFDLVSGSTVNNWVVLNINKDYGKYSIDFVDNNGSTLAKSMPDYTAKLKINDDVKKITIKNNTFKDDGVNGDYLLTSLNSTNVLARTTLNWNITNYNISTSDCVYGENSTVTVKVNSYATGFVTVKVDDCHVFIGIIDNGMVNIPLSNLNAGDHNLNIYYSGDENYLPFNTTAKVTVNPNSVSLVPSALSTTYDSGKYFQVKVVDSDGNAIANLKLTLKVYTGTSYKTVYVTTNADGIAKYSASKLSIGTHKVIVSLSDEIYQASSITSSVKVAKAKTTVTAPVVKNKYKKSAYFKVTVKNSVTKKIIKSLSLKVKVYTGKKYKTYTIKTNSKGIASLNTKSLTKGTHKVVITSGNSCYTVSKSGNLIVIK